MRAANSSPAAPRRTRCAQCGRPITHPYWSHINTPHQAGHCVDCSRRQADRQWMRYLQLQLPMGGAQ